MQAMALQLFILVILYSSHIVAAKDPIQGLLQQGAACFQTIKKPSQCNSTLAESFTPRSRNVSGDKPATQVFLFTPSNPNKAELLHDCGGQLPPGSKYDPKANTEVFIHGWLDGVCRTAWMREMKEQLLQRAKRLKTSYNIILVDWTWGNTPDYYVASQNCKIVGEQVGFIINNIIEQKKSEGVGPEKFHIVGHSFGAIASGFVGRSVKGLRRITALDPAYAPFGNVPPSERVTYRDANIVDVIHSNGFECFAVALGDSRQLGHADFYPNGGTVQLSCYTYIFSSLLKGDIVYGLASLDPRLCYHLQALQFYKVSINPVDKCQLIGVISRSYEQFQNERVRIEDKNWAVMGMDYELYHRNDGERRSYYLKTSNFCPYSDYSYLKRRNRLPSNLTCKAMLTNAFVNDC